MDAMNQTTDSNAAMLLMMEQMNALGQIVGQLQSQVTELSSRIPTPAPTPVESESEHKSDPPNPPKNATTDIQKSEKFPDPPMYDGKRKNLRPFVSKLRAKLRRNHDRYPSDQDKVDYSMSRLEGDAARTMDPFYRSNTFHTLDDFISLLEQTYDDASREHTAMAKLETLRQKNLEFTSFFSEFLGLIGELDWNESAKVAALRQKISDEIREQLVGRTIPRTLGEFATICQQIDEDLRYNQSARSRRIAANRPATTNRPTVNRPATTNATTKPSTPSHDLMDIDASRAQYAPAGSDERKDRLTKGACFGCGQKGHLHRDCPTNPYSKIRSYMSSTTSANVNPRNTPTPSTYAASVAGGVALPPSESENE